MLENLITIRRDAVERTQNNGFHPVKEASRVSCFIGDLGHEHSEQAFKGLNPKLARATLDHFSLLNLGAGEGVSHVAESSAQ